MKRTIFYSWQSDLPNATNRGFIQEALEKVVTTIANNDTVAVEPVIDRDTQGVAGSPDIASTIFSKITAADVFVADISIITKVKNGRMTPNPNVLIELGYALKCLGHERIMLIFNKSFGKIEDLPFDLRTRRVVVYEMPLNEKDRATGRKILEKQLENAILSALSSIPEPQEEPIKLGSIEAIENNKPNKTIILRRDLMEILKKIDTHQPLRNSEGGTADDLITSINLSQELAVEFSKITEVVAVLKDQESATEIYKWFGKVVERYDYPQGKDGRISNADHDYFKFIGNELFVMMIAFYVREQCWDILKKILNEPLTLPYLKYESGPSSVTWTYPASFSLPLLDDESHKKRRVSIRADIIKERHTSGLLASVVPLEEFIANDFFLFLLGTITQPANNRHRWIPWSIIYIEQTPAFIKKAQHKQYAMQLRGLFNLPSIEELKIKLKEKYPSANRLFSGMWDLPISDSDIDKIDTK